MSEKDRNNTIGLAHFDGKKNQLMDMWFQDSIELAHGFRMSIKIRDVLAHYRSKFQEIAVLETESIGRMLVLDGITMLTEFDEFAYHEMIVHVPLLVHPNPSRVLIIGGGDGGTAREVLKHKEVEQVLVCELDREVIKACREFLPSLAHSFDDSRVEIVCRDGAEFVSQSRESYDIIIVDSTDPVGPGQVLFQRPFYEAMKGALKPDGIAVTQCESIYLHQEVIRGVSEFAREMFQKVAYYFTMVPTYPSGTIGFLFCSLAYDPLKDFSKDRAAMLKDLRYYTTEIHKSSFSLPHFGRVLLGK